MTEEKIPSKKTVNLAVNLVKMHQEETLSQTVIEQVYTIKLSVMNVSLKVKQKFTMEKHSNEIPFLDILIINNGDGKITTDIYRKPTDSQQFLHFQNSHPKSCLKAIPYTLARRLCTIISSEHILETRLNELYHTLRQRGYPSSLINQGINLALQAPQENLR